MNRTAINNFAQWARREMVTKVSQRAAKYGITEDNHGSTKEDSVNGVLLSRIELKERNALIEEIEKKGYREVMDEVAYTWFNRFIALRFMEVNGYLPTMIRVFTDENNNFRPQILTEAINLDMDGLNMEKVYEYKNKNDSEGLFKYLIITQCNALSTPLPRMFQKINDYTELLFPDYLLRSGSVISEMITLIPEDDWKEQVQIIGWLYQFYISEKKDEVFESFKKGKKAGAGEIPAATQLFTPDWIVRYLVDNSLGRLWMLNHPDSTLTAHMSYYIKPCESESDFIRLSSPEEIKLSDPCCGSGHMLTYAFDLLFDIYAECGYTTKDAVEHIIKDNLYGIELDNRAGQLSYFALMMKAREKSRRFFSSGVQPNVCVLNNISFTEEEMIEATSLFNRKNDLLITNLLSQYEHADTLGSLITPIIDDISSLKAMLTSDTTGDLFSNPNDSIYTRVQDVLKFSEFLSKRYHVVVTNPPYMGNSNMGETLKKYLEEEYKDYKYDMFSAFFVRCCGLAVANGYLGFMSPYVWMFISSYEKLRNLFIEKKTITSLAQLEYSAFEDATVPLCIFTIKNAKDDIKGSYFRLTEFTGGMEIQNKKILEAISNHDCGYYYEVSAEQFKKIPGSPIAYWASEHIFMLFDNSPSIVTRLKPYQGLATGDNGRFLRLWHEISTENICYEATSTDESKLSKKKWFPYNKGGDYRKWFGNEDYLVNWENDGEEIRHFTDDKGKLRSRPQNTKSYFKTCISWSKISSGFLSFRYKNRGFIFDVAGPSIFGDINELKYAIGFLNSNVALEIASFMSPTLNYEVGQIANYPLVYGNTDQVSDVVNLIQCNISLSKKDWDSFETSWDFKRSPLLFDNHSSLEDAYISYRDRANTDFYQLKLNEEELNRIFIDIYGLGDELKPEEEEKMVSIHRIYDSESEIPLEEKEDENGKKKKVRMPYAMTKMDVVKNFISYAVGCMFGRYSLDVEGLAYAGGEWDDSKYSSFIPDKDNIIPITEEDYFDDDILSRFIEFVKVCYGEESLEDNLKFIADALEGKGTPREVIRSYFLNDFYKDHLKMYQKRPIYWLFDSGKKNGFKALIYMHRYHSDTVARIRTDYVHEIQNRYRSILDELEKKIDNAFSTSDKVKLDKNIALFKVKAEEVRIYEEKIHHLADGMIEIDFDDGVKVNYAFFQNVLAPIK